MSSQASGSVYRNERPALPAGAQTLPARFYADPEVHRAELARIHGALWIYAARASEIPDRGDYVLLELDGESLVVVRDDHGAPRAFHNLCRHRGTRLLGEESGNVGHCLRCPYHAWTYALDDGRLTGAPHMGQTEGFCLDDHGLGRVACAEWEGHLFISLADDPPALAEQLGDLPRLLAPWPMAELRRVHRIVYEVAANWKLIIQNYSECLHCPIIHPRLQQLSHYLSGENAPPHPGYLGGSMELRPEIESLTMDGKSPWSPLPGLSEADRRRVAYFAVLPGMLLNLHPDYMMTYRLLPRGHDRTEVVCDWHFHPEEIARPGFDPGPAVELWDLTNREDWDVSELAQKGIASRAYKPGPYSNREELLWALDRWVV